MIELDKFGLVKFWELECFKPKYSINGIPIYNLNDLKVIIENNSEFKKYFAPDNKIELPSLKFAGPTNPLILTGLDYLLIGSNYYSKQKGITFFHSHGRDGKERNPPINNWMLRQWANPEFVNVPIIDLYRSVATQIKVDLIHTCNEGGYTFEQLENEQVFYSDDSMSQDFKLINGKFINAPFGNGQILGAKIENLIKADSQSDSFIKELLDKKREHKSSSKIKNLLKPKNSSIHQ